MLWKRLRSLENSEGISQDYDAYAARPLYAYSAPLPIDELSVGYGDTCGKLRDGRAWCAGLARDGADGTIPGLSNVIKLRSGGIGSCALRSTGTIHCWSHPGYLGDPYEPAGVDDAVDLGTNGVTTCALRANGTVSCWGQDTWGMLGRGTSTWGPEMQPPAPVSRVAGAQRLVFGYHTACVFLKDGTQRCWGTSSVLMGRGSNLLLGTAVTVIGL